MQQVPARSEPTESPERPWSCFALWLLFKKTEAALFTRYLPGCKAQIRSFANSRGKSHANEDSAEGILLSIHSNRGADLQVTE